MVKEVRVLDLIINSKKRMKHFIQRVTKSNIVWGLQSTDGWCVCESNEFEDVFVMLFWSDHAYAQQCAINEWSNYVATPIQLEEFLMSWVPGLENEGLLIGPNWTKQLIGLEVEPSDLASLLTKSDNKK